MSIAALSSCYGDKGNYVYNFDEMNSIDSLEFTPATVETLMVRQSNSLSL